MMQITFHQHHVVMNSHSHSPLMCIIFIELFKNSIRTLIPIIERNEV